MDAEPSKRSVDRIIWNLAAKQSGAVARRQLLELGVTREEIATRLRNGVLTEVHRGVYLVGAVPAKHALAQAALLAAGEDAALSHFSAAHLWEARPYPATAPVWVTIPLARRVERARIHIARADLAATDIRIRQRMRVTSPARTALDCAGRLSDPYELESLVAELRYRGRATEVDLAAEVSRHPNKHGASRLRRILRLPGGPQRTRSKGERALIRLLREEGIEGFEVNSKAFGPELDFVWPALRFAVELDGWDGHSGRVAFERNRLKIAELQTQGVQVMPVTSRQIRDDSDGIARRLQATLRSRRIR